MNLQLYTWSGFSALNDHPFSPRNGSTTERPITFSRSFNCRTMFVRCAFFQRVIIMFNSTTKNHCHPYPRTCQGNVQMVPTPVIISVVSIVENFIDAFPSAILLKAAAPCDTLYAPFGCKACMGVLFDHIAEAGRFSAEFAVSRSSVGTRASVIC